jgi:hypothetical protein
VAPGRGVTALCVPNAGSRRALLRWTSGRLGRRSNVQQGNIVKTESVDDVPNISGADLQAIKTTLESASVEFIGMVGVKLFR